MVQYANTKSNKYVLTKKTKKGDSYQSPRRDENINNTVQAKGAVPCHSDVKELRPEGTRHIHEHELPLIYGYYTIIHVKYSIMSITNATLRAIFEVTLTRITINCH